MPRLNEQELADFLDEPGHLLRLATTDDTGMPVVVPVWFIRQDDLLLVTPRARSAWRRHLERDTRTCFSIDEDPAPYRKLTVQGSVQVVHGLGEDDAWRDTYRRIACRYVPERSADAYLTNTWNEPRALLGLPWQGPEVTISTWRMPVAGEDARGVWADKYYGAQV